jgi:catechol 2,3-dioxygenase-like lactoylglutathione lyase family enzyme
MIDCPGPRALADFYTQLLGMRVDRDEDGWVVITDDAGHLLAYQRVADLREPRWPDQQRLQQFHIGVMGDDIDEAQKAALEIGATRLPHEGPDFRVYADPVGHPFCLCRHERIGLSTLDAQPSGALARYR